MNKNIVVRAILTIGLCLISLARSKPHNEAEEELQRQKREVVLVRAVGEVPDSFGRHFTIAFMTNGNKNDGGYLKLFLASSVENETRVHIEIPELGRVEDRVIPGNDLIEVEIPAPDKMRISKKERLKPINKVVDITSDFPIGVYGINRRKVSSDAFLALPEDVATNEYIIPSYPGHRTRRTGNPGEVAVVAYRDRTKVVLIQNDVEEASVVLDKGQVFEYFRKGTREGSEVQDDLTGMRVLASAPVGVFSGTICADVPQTFGLCDHIVEQIPPLATWGRRYVTAPLVRRLAGDIFRIISGRDDNVIKVSNKTFRLEKAGDFGELDIPSNESHIIECSKACLVVLYCKGKNADGVLADPFMMMLPPTEQFSNDYIFATPDDERIKKEFDNFVNIVVRTDKVDGMILDDVRLASDDWTKVPGSEFSYLRKEITSGIHFAHHESPIVGFGLYVYGFANYDSYGYPGGLRLGALYEECVPQKEEFPGDGIDNDCDGKVDEELYPNNGIDDDGDGVIDENDRAKCRVTRPLPADKLDNDCDGIVDEEKQNGKDDDGDGKIDEDIDDGGGCDTAASQAALKDGVDALKADLNDMLNLLAALKDLVMPMAERLVHLENDAANLAECCA